MCGVFSCRALAFLLLVLEEDEDDDDDDEEEEEEEEEEGEPFIHSRDCRVELR